MQVGDIVERFRLEVAAGANGLQRTVRDGYCGDLLSDVMGKAPEQCIWLTVQGHQNILAVAVLRDISAIVITGGHRPDEDTANRADQEDIPILLWPGSTFQLAGKLHSAGVGTGENTA